MSKLPIAVCVCIYIKPYKPYAWPVYTTEAFVPLSLTEWSNFTLHSKVVRYIGKLLMLVKLGREILPLLTLTQDKHVHTPLSARCLWEFVGKQLHPNVNLASSHRYAYSHQASGIISYEVYTLAWLFCVGDAVQVLRNSFISDREFWLVCHIRETFDAFLEQSCMGLKWSVLAHMCVCVCVYLKILYLASWASVD